MRPRAPIARSFRAILCPVDFSAHSRTALRYAEAIARRSGARLTVLYANDPLLAAAAAAAYHGRARFSQQTLAELRRFVKAALRPATLTSLSVRCIVTVGNPAHAIVAAATRRKADLIVIATQGLGGLHKLLVGSTTQRVLAKAPMPVLAVPRTGGRRQYRLPPAGWPGERLIAALDLQDGAGADAAEAAAIARWLGAALLLVHVIRKVQRPPWVRMRFPPLEQNQFTRTRSALEAIAASIGSDVDTRCVVRRGDPANEIAALAARRTAGLVVLTRGHGQGPFTSLPGTITYEILRHAVVPVLALPVRS